MQYNENHLTSLKDKLKTGRHQRECDMLVKALDIRTKQMLKELNFEPEAIHHYQLMALLMNKSRSWLQKWLLRKLGLRS